MDPASSRLQSFFCHFPPPQACLQEALASTTANYKRNWWPTLLSQKFKTFQNSLGKFVKNAYSLVWLPGILMLKVWHRAQKQAFLKLLTIITWMAQDTHFEKITHADLCSTGLSRWRPTHREHTYSPSLLHFFHLRVGRLSFHWGWKLSWTQYDWGKTKAFSERGTAWKDIPTQACLRLPPVPSSANGLGKQRKYPY